MEDLANQVRTVSFPGASGTQTVTISHDTLSRRTGVDRPGAAADTTYAYDVDNDLTGLTRLRGGDWAGLDGLHLRP